MPKRQENEDCLTAFIEKMTSFMQDGFERQIASLREELEIVKKDLKEIKTELKMEKEKNKKMLQEKEELKEEMLSINGDLNYLLQKMDDSEQEKRNLDVVIDDVDEGLIKGEKDPFVHLVNKTLMGKVLEAEEMSATKIVRKKTNGRLTVIGTLKSQAAKRAILSQKKMFYQKNMYVKENLTPHRFKLLMDTRRFARENNVKFVWTRDGEILWRKDEQSRAIIVKDRSSLKLN